MLSEPSSCNVIALLFLRGIETCCLIFFSKITRFGEDVCLIYFFLYLRAQRMFGPLLIPMHVQFVVPCVVCVSELTHVHEL
jgi:hypothetical protein